MRRIFLILGLSVVCLSAVPSPFERKRLLVQMEDNVALANSPTSNDDGITISLESHHEGDTQRRRKRNDPRQ